VAFFAAGGSVSKTLTPEAVKRGCLAIDKSSAWRMDPKVPLVVPEINVDALRSHQGIIASPNCSTAVALMALYPLHQAFGLKRVFFATYQSVSGTGAPAVRELEAQVQAYAAHQPLVHTVYPHQIFQNVIPHIDSFGADGYTGEETKNARREPPRFSVCPISGSRPPASVCRWCAPIRWRSTPNLSDLSPSTRPAGPSPGLPGPS